MFKFQFAKVVKYVGCWKREVGGVNSLIFRILDNFLANALIRTQAGLSVHIFFCDQGLLPIHRKKITTIIPIANYVYKLRFCSNSLLEIKMSLLRSSSELDSGFYKHFAPTELCKNY